jgi:16S rRNA (guanine1207-N2)-methyltransferase
MAAQRRPDSRNKGTNKALGAIQLISIAGGSTAVWLREDMPVNRIVKPGEHVACETLERLRPSHVLEVGSNVGVVGLSAIQNGWVDKITFVMRDAVGANSVRNTLKSRSIENAVLVVGDGPLDAPVESYDVVIVHQQPSRRLTELLIRQALTRVGDEAAIFMCGEVKEGVRTSARYMEELCEDVENIDGGRDGCVIIGRRPRPDAALSEPTPRSERTAVVDGITLRWLTAPGVFSADGLDPATELLLNTIVLPRKGKILDMGCGSGILGMYAALRMPQCEITMVETDVASVRCSEEGIRLNGIQNAEVILSDGIEALGRKRFDVVLTNPPVHRVGRRDARLVDRFAREAAQSVGRKGRLWLVTAPTVPVSRTLQELFTSITVIDDEEGRFRVYDAIRRPQSQVERKEFADRESTIDIYDGWEDADDLEGDW